MAIILPLVTNLHSPAMRDRHWRTLQHLTHKQLDKGPSFALQDLLALDLHRHVDGVNEIVQVRKGGWVYGWMDGWMDGWMGGWMDMWMDMWMDLHSSVLFAYMS